MAERILMRRRSLLLSGVGLAAVLTIGLWLGIAVQNGSEIRLDVSLNPSSVPQGRQYTFPWQPEIISHCQTIRQNPGLGQLRTCRWAVAVAPMALLQSPSTPEDWRSRIIPAAGGWTYSTLSISAGPLSFLSEVRFARWRTSGSGRSKVLGETLISGVSGLWPRCPLRTVEVCTTRAFCVLSYLVSTPYSPEMSGVTSSSDTSRFYRLKRLFRIDR